MENIQLQKEVTSLVNKLKISLNEYDEKSKSLNSMHNVFKRHAADLELFVQEKLLNPDNLKNREWFLMWNHGNRYFETHSGFDFHNMADKGYIESNIERVEKFRTNYRICLTFASYDDTILLKNDNLEIARYYIENILEGKVVCKQFELEAMGPIIRCCKQLINDDITLKSFKKQISQYITPELSFDNDDD